MLFLFTIFLALAAVATLVLLVRRQDRRELPENQQFSYLDEPTYRPLFAPDEEELERAERERIASEALNAERESAEKELASFEEFRQTWRESPTRKNTIELLLRASQTESGEIFMEVVDELLHKRPEAFSPDDTAQLIESHFWLLPPNERTPGATFTINRELAALRGGSKAMSDEEASDA